MGLLKRTMNEIIGFPQLSKPIGVNWKESAGGLKQRFLKEKDPDKKKRLQVFWLLRDGHSIPEVSQIMGIDQHDISQWMKEYEMLGLDEVIARRTGGNINGQGHDHQSNLKIEAMGIEQEMEYYSPSQIYADIASFIRIMITNLWVIVLVFAIGMGITYFLVQQQPRIYESKTTMIVSPRTITGDSADILRSIDVMNFDVIGTYIQVLRSQSALQNAIDSFKGEFSARLLQDAVVEIRPVENSAVIVVNTRSESPSVAYLLAREIPNQIMTDNVPESLINLYPIQVLDPAVVPQEPVSPNIRLSYLLGAVGSLILGVGLAFIWNSLKFSPQYSAE